jgi:hypothetical protein
VKRVLWPMSRSFRWLWVTPTGRGPSPTTAPGCSCPASARAAHSVGVARQYCGRLAKTDNCQIAVSLSVGAASLPLAFRLYLPQEWVDDFPRVAPCGRVDRNRRSASASPDDRRRAPCGRVDAAATMLFDRTETATARTGPSLRDEGANLVVSNFRLSCRIRYLPSSWVRPRSASDLSSGRSTWPTVVKIARLVNALKLHRPFHRPLQQEFLERYPSFPNRPPNFFPVSAKMAPTSDMRDAPAFVPVTIPSGHRCPLRSLHRR